MSIALQRHTRPLPSAGSTRTRGASDGKGDARHGDAASGEGAGEFTGGAPAPRPWLAPSVLAARAGESPAAFAGEGAPATTEGEEAAGATPPATAGATAPTDSTSGPPPEGGTGAPNGDASEEASTTASAVGTASANSPADEAALQPVLAQVKDKLAALADDPEKFHEALNKAFGGGYDKAAAETIRQQTLAGDFSWLPKIEVVDGATLADTSGGQGGATGLAAYSAENDTVYISRELLSDDPSKAASILTEEIGHGLDTRLNVADSAGDEGEIFSALVDGKELSDTELAALKAENDTGTIIVDGKEVEVEFFLGKIVKGAKKLVKKAVDTVTDVVKKPFEVVVDHVKSVAKYAKKAFNAIMQSELLGQVMAIAQYIPIPIVAAVATVYNTVRAGYMVYRGIKEGSVSAILGGVAGLAGGAAKLGPAFGAGEKFVKTAATISSRASTASKLYAAKSDLSFRSAASIGSSLFGGTKAGGYFRAADRGFAAKDAFDRGDVLGGIALGADAFRELPGERYDAALGKVGEYALDTRAIVGAVRDGDYASALGQINSTYGGHLGLDAEGRAKVDGLVDVLGTVQGAVALADGGGDYLGAAETLFGKAAEYSSSPTVRSRFQGGAEIFAKLGKVEDDFRKGRFDSAADGALALLGEPLDDKTRGRLLDVLDGKRIETVTRLVDRGGVARDAIRNGDVLGGLAIAADAFRELPGERHDKVLGDVTGHALDARAIVGAVRDGDYSTALGLVNDTYGTWLGLDAEGRAKVDGLVDVIDTVETATALVDGEGDYAGAAEFLLGKAAERSTSPIVRSRLEGGADTLARIGDVREAISEGRLESATTGTLALLGEPLDDTTRGRLLGVLEFIDTLRGTSEPEPTAAPVAAAA